MKMKYLVLTFISLGVLAGCGSSSSSVSNTGGSVDNSTEFNRFVLNLVQNQTANMTEAVAINALMFEFEVEGLEDETAFDVLF